MLHRTILTSLIAMLIVLGASAGTKAQSIQRDYGQNDYERTRVDRYLDVEVWVDHSDGEYYEGENVVISFRSNRDAFVSIYSIDSRGRVNLLFPVDATDDNFIFGGVTYSLPGKNDDYDLAVTGPEGFENIQIIGSRERFPIPNWYHNSGLVDDWDDRDEFMDYVNATHFVRYGGQRFAYDRAAFYVNEWEEYYYQPVYYPYYPSWTLYGNAYIDYGYGYGFGQSYGYGYGYGSSVYINGIYWGCAPLYIPRLAVGWHTLTIYDSHNYAYETDFHVSRHNTVVFNDRQINPTSTVRSKYKDVRRVGYRDPVKNGYPKFNKNRVVVSTSLDKYGKKGAVVTKTKRTGSNTVGKDGMIKPTRKYERGSTTLVKTKRGYETDAMTAMTTARKQSTQRRSSRTSRGSEVRTSKGKRPSSGYDTNNQAIKNRTEKSSTGRTATTTRRVDQGSKRKSSGSADYYQKRSGSKKQKSSATVRSSNKSPRSTKTLQSTKKKSTSAKTKGSTYKKHSGSRKSSGSTRSVQPKTRTKPSGSTKSVQPKSKSKPSGGARVKSSSGKSSRGSSSTSGSKKFGSKSKGKKRR